MEPIGIAQATAAMNGQLLQGSPETVVSGVAIDSRDVSPGKLFFALLGARSDGHLYVGDVLNRGGAAVISRQVQVNAAQSQRPLIMVADTLQAMQDLAGYYRRLFSLPVVAVKGSTGKTTTKDLIAGVLGTIYRVLKTEGNQNNEIGLPLTLMRIDRDCDAVVLEMAMRGQGQIAALCRLSQPQIGVVTNIGMTHMESLGSQEAIAEAKGELLRALPPGGCAVLNGDDPWQRRLADQCNCEVIFYGEGDGTAVSARNIVMYGLRGSEWLLQTPLGEATCHLPHPGRHNISNALAAAAVGCQLGLRPEQIAHGLETVSLTGRRLEIKKGIRGSTIVDDTYNASPASVKAALRLLADIPDRGRSIAVLGDMYELGQETVSGHRAVGEYAATLQIDYLFTVGELAREIAEGARAAGMPTNRVGVCPDNQTVTALVRDFVKSGDVVLIKGSRGVRMEEIVAPLSEGC